MKYWFYSEGNILGPYAPSELLSLPAFGQGSLVCPETATGDNPGDWRAAEAVAEIASALSVGVGGVISSQAGGISGLYELETGLSSTIGAAYSETGNDQPYGYENLLNTIDNILGAKDSAAPSAANPAPDYELMDRFDIRLSRIQEELEAARWEKNLLLEKIRAKEAEERKNRERIAELEGKLKGALDQTDSQEKGLSQVRYSAGLSAKTETLKQTDELRKEDSIDRSSAPSSPAGQSVGESRILKSIQSGQAVPLEPTFAVGGTLPRPYALQGDNSENKKEEEDNSAISSRKLRSLGRSSAPVIPFSGEEHKGGAPGSESFSIPAYAAPKETLPPLPQQASGIIYDFTITTGQPAENEKVQFKVEPKQEPAPQFHQPAPQVQPQNVWQPQPPSAQPQYSWQSASQVQPQPSPVQPVQSQNSQQTEVFPVPARDAEAAALKPEPGLPGLKGATTSKESAIPDKTGSLTVSSQKQKEAANKNVQPVRKGHGKVAFLSTMIVLSGIAVGGLCYFFLGGGVSFSEFSMLNLGGSGKSKKASFSTQIEPKADKAQTETAAAEDTLAPGQDQRNQGEAQEASAAAPSAPVKPAFESGSNENTRKAIETVKSYKLSGGRGTVASWFANSFLSNPASGSNEEWSATVLHGDIFVVQYRLLRPKQDPLIYQFEVDVAKGLIVRGINNNAIELLDFSSKVTAKAEPAAKPRARKAAPRAGKSRGIPILPLPDEPAAKPSQEYPTGFETTAPEGNEKVKYIMAQESDEELF